MENNIEILLVEDTPSDVRLTQEALKRSGLKYTMSVVNDGVEAMDYLNERKTGGQQMPDLILLDLNMRERMVTKFSPMCKPIRNCRRFRSCF